MAGSLINKKIDTIRAYYDENDKANSNYDFIYPNSIFEAIYESLTPGALNLAQVLEMRDSSLNVSLSIKQDKIPAGNANNIVAFSGTAGTVSELQRATTIATTGTASDTKIPTEKAVVDYANNEIVPKINKVKTDLTTKIDGVETRVAANESALVTANGKISQLTSDVSGLTSDVEQIKTTVSGHTNDIIDIRNKLGTVTDIVTDTDNPDGLPKLVERVETLENTSLHENSFGDKKYIKDIEMTGSGGSVIITEKTATVNSPTVETTAVTLGSTDGSVILTLTGTGAVKTLDLKAAVSGDALGNKVDKNPAISPGTATKISYDEKGLVTGSGMLLASDIPLLTIDKISGLQASLDGKASISDLSALQTAINSKADKSVVDTLQETVDNLGDIVKLITMDETVQLVANVFS